MKTTPSAECAGSFLPPPAHAASDVLQILRCPIRMWSTHRIQEHALKNAVIPAKMRGLDPFQLYHIISTHQKHGRTRLSFLKKFPEMRLRF